MRTENSGNQEATDDSLSTGGYLTLAEAAAQLPGRPHLSTIHRWRLRGVRGVRLRTCLVGGRRFTRPEWLRQFIVASSEAGDQHAVPRTEPARDREKAIRAAEAELDAAGI